jgi:hypothetical protein
MIWLVIVFMLVAAVLSFYRLRRGGPGPAMNWIPRFMRPRANAEYEKQGWTKPFNDDGTRNSGRGQI